MISFELPEEQKHWQEKARDFVEKEIKSLVWNINRELTREFLRPLIKKWLKRGFCPWGCQKNTMGAGWIN